METGRFGKPDDWKFPGPPLIRYHNPETGATYQGPPVMRTTDASGREIVFTWDSEGYVVVVDDPQAVADELARAAGLEKVIRGGKGYHRPEANSPELAAINNYLHASVQKSILTALPRTLPLAMMRVLQQPAAVGATVTGKTEILLKIQKMMQDGRSDAEIFAEIGWDSSKEAFVDTATAGLGKGAAGALGKAINKGNADDIARAASATRKAINLPAWKKIVPDWTHIAERHIAGGAFAKNKKTVFGNLTLPEVKNVVKGAYEHSKKVATQGDRVLVRGTYNGWVVEMWINLRTKALETAYPI